MTMVGDMFNNGLESKLDAVCSELAQYAAETSSKGQVSDREAIEVSFRKAPQQLVASWSWKAFVSWRSK